MALEIFVIFLIVGTVGAAVWGIYYYLSTGGETPDGAPEVEEYADHHSRFEQILSELQGIKLSMESGNTRNNFPKVTRLVRVFLGKLGLQGAREMTLPTLKDAIAASSMSAKHIQMLAGIIDRCEKGENSEALKLEFDPLEVVRDLKYVIHQIEGRMPD